MEKSLSFHYFFPLVPSSISQLATTFSISSLDEKEDIEVSGETKKSFVSVVCLSVSMGPSRFEDLE